MFYEKHWFGNSETYDIYPLINENFPFHFHRSYEMIFLIEGVLTVNVETRPYRMNIGEVAFIFPNQVHSLVPDGAYKCMIVIFAPELIGQFSSKYRKWIPQINVFPSCFAAEELLQFQNPYQVKGFLYTMCGELVEHTDFIGSDRQSSQFLLLHQILTFIDEHLNETCTLAQAAKNLQYEYSYLSRFFSDTMGMTYTSYLNQYRINRASYLLRNNLDSIAAIAMQCGYDTIRTFNRNFRQITGTTPAVYRNSGGHMITGSVQRLPVR